MRRWFGFILAVLAAALLGYWIGMSTAVRAGPSPDMAEGPDLREAEPETSRAARSAAERAVVSAVDSLPSLPQTLLDNAAGDLDGDGAPEKIELYAAVDRDEEGRLMWDDGQHWALIVRDGDLIYHLVNELVQLGRVSFWLVEPMAAEPPAILVQRATGAGVRVEKYVYDEELRGFVSAGAIEVSGNVVHQTPPTIGI